ncbi:hypothetical protein AOB60_09730 [Streptomyces noursei]|uniref:Uncharacterized protein n=1 Tax=Streptomyces noursei TaxID=1971 RepID=A0A2N8PJ12_STRNR|nr:hypothetical protein AOB60_09730 [Streptomyces noursei]
MSRPSAGTRRPRGPTNWVCVTAHFGAPSREATIDAYGDGPRALIHEEGLADRLSAFDLRAAYGDLPYAEKQTRDRGGARAGAGSTAGRDPGRRVGPSAVPTGSVGASPIPPIVTLRPVRRPWATLVARHG